VRAEILVDLCVGKKTDGICLGFVGISRESSRTYVTVRVQGYWRNHLAGRKYHISAIYVVDLVKFRQIAAGDRLRGTENKWLIDTTGSKTQSFRKSYTLRPPKK
jgi:hypothetical protein